MTVTIQKVTPGPWRVGNSGGVVSDLPIDGGVPGTADVEYYGGHLICETVTSANAKLIAAAPDLLDALIKISSFDIPIEIVDVMDETARAIVEIAKAAIAKATGAPT